MASLRMRMWRARTISGVANLGGVLFIVLGYGGVADVLGGGQRFRADEQVFHVGLRGHGEGCLIGFVIVLDLRVVDGNLGGIVFQRVENILQNAAFAFIAEEIAHFGFGNEGPGGDVRAELVHQHVVAELGFEVAGGVALGLDHADIGVGIELGLRRCGRRGSFR